MIFQEGGGSLDSLSTPTGSAQAEANDYDQENTIIIDHMAPQERDIITQTKMHALKRIQLK